MMDDSTPFASVTQRYLPQQRGPWRRRTLAPWLVTFVALAAGCSSTTSSGDSSCVAGATEPCLCPNGTAATRVCSAEGRFGECACESGEGGAANTGGSEGTGATGGTHATGGAGTGGAAGGGDGSGGVATGGESAGGDGSGGVATGGASTGGVATGGDGSGGASTGGVATGGASTGGVATGGASTGGVATGGASTGGVATGGTGGTGACVCSSPDGFCSNGTCLGLTTTSLDGWTAGTWDRTLTVGGNGIWVTNSCTETGTIEYAFTSPVSLPTGGITFTVLFSGTAGVTWQNVQGFFVSNGTEYTSTSYTVGSGNQVSVTLGAPAAARENITRVGLRAIGCNAPYAMTTLTLRSVSAG